MALEYGFDVPEGFSNLVVREILSLLIDSLGVRAVPENPWLQIPQKILVMGQN